MVMSQLVTLFAGVTQQAEDSGCGVRPSRGKFAARKFASKDDTCEVELPPKQSISIADFEVLPSDSKIKAEEG
jgi:hypothetical protein